MGRDLTALRVGFEQGLYCRDDVREWVDAEIVARDVLAPELLELATMSRRHDVEIVGLLKALDGDVPIEVTARLEIAVVSEMYRRGRLSFRDTIGALESCRAWTPGLPESIAEAILQLMCAYDVAEYGSYGTLEDVRSELDAFLAEHPFPGAASVDAPDAR